MMMWRGVSGFSGTDGLRFSGQDDDFVLFRDKVGGAVSYFC